MQLAVTLLVLAVCVYVAVVVTRDSARHAAIQRTASKTGVLARVAVDAIDQNAGRLQKIEAALPAPFDQPPSGRTPTPLHPPE